MSSVILKKIDEVQSDSLLTIIFIGSSGAGKTSLITRVHSGEFTPTCMATIGVDSWMIGATINGRDYKVRLSDTAGAERFDSIVSTYYRSVNGAMVVYDITNYESYEMIKYWMLQIQNYASKKYPVILLGNKSDIDMQHHIHGQKVAEDLEMDGFFKTSAKTGEGIDDAMKLMIELIVSSNDSLSTSQNEKLSKNLREQQPNKCTCNF